jgi:poly(3-hydroxyalkanoate) synthetase
MASSDATSSGVNFLLDFAGFLRAHLISRHQLYRLLSSLNLTQRSRPVCPVFFLYSLNDLTRSWKFMCDMIVDKSAISCGVYATCTLEMKIRVVVAVRRVVAHHTNRHQRVQSRHDCHVFHIFERLIIVHLKNYSNILHTGK